MTCNKTTPPYQCEIRIHKNLKQTLMACGNNCACSKTIIKKATGNITISSFDAGEELAEKTFPFDIFIQIIDGAPEVLINTRKYKLGLGKGIIIPANARHNFKAKEQFKMISTVIKSGYED